jgi:glycosyltransferase involved in cell wall biosynthesis
MRLLITQETDWIKRNPLQQHHLAELLSLRGHEIRVIDYELLWRSQGKRKLFSRRQVFPGFHKIYDDARVTVVRPGIIKIPLLDYISLVCTHRGEINRQIKEFKPDVIIGFGILNSYLAVKAAHRNHIPFAYHWLDVLHWLIHVKALQPLGKLVESRTLRQSDKVIAVSDKMKDFLIEMGAAPDKTDVVKPGISLTKFDPAISGDRVRQQYGIKETDVVLLFMGWLYRFSGMKEVALELAKAKKNHVKLLIVGEGDAYVELQRIRDDNGLKDSLILTGRQPYEQIQEFIAAADICLLPADPNEKVMHDGLPAKIYEYLAMAKPMISTRLLGVMREFGDGNGVVYIDRPEDTLNKALEMVDAGQVKALGAKARKFVESYDWTKITDRYERIMKDLSASRHTPA